MNFSTKDRVTKFELKSHIVILTDPCNAIKSVGQNVSNVASVGSVFNDTQKVKVLSLPETIKEKSTFQAKALGRCPTCADELTEETLAEPQRMIKVYLNELNIRCPDEGPSLETPIFPLSFQVVREPLPFAYHWTKCRVLGILQQSVMSNFSHIILCCEISYLI